VPPLHEALASYVPVLVTRRLASDPQPLAAPRSDAMSAAVMFADISGFTALTELLARQGPAGVEKVAAGLNDYFGQLIAIIEAHGGDVVKFAGDALTAIWPQTDGEDGPPLQRAALQAVDCAMAIQSEMHGFRISDGTDLAVRVGVGASKVAAVHIGGLAGRWELMLTGSAVLEGLRAEALAHPGHVVVAPRVWSLVEAHVRGRPLPEDYVLIDEIAAPIPREPLERPALPPEAEAALRGYVPAAVSTRLAAGQSSWLAELRRVSVLFVNLPAMSHATALAEAQDVMAAIQQIVHGCEGSVNYCSVDGHGATVMAAFGLPPLAHEDDAVRSIDAAQQLREILNRLGWQAVVGVASGKAFCGSVGGAARCAYTVLGDVVNLAARLMQAADELLPIICDNYTFTAARGQFLFEAYPPITVKGKSQPIPLHSPASGRLPNRATGRPISGPVQAAQGTGPVVRPALVGRMRERVVLVGKLHDLLRGRSATVVVEGEAGLGKSRLADDLLDQAEAMGIRRLVGAREASDAAAAYHAWTPVFRHLFGIDENTRDADAWDKVRAEILRFAPDALLWAPLFASVLALDDADTERTAALSGKARAEATREVLVELLGAALKGGPALLLIEDAHWVDSASWALLAQVRAQVHPLLVVLVTGPVESDTDPAPPELRQLLADAGTYHLVLGPLSLAETESMVCRKLGVTRLPAEVADFIYEKAEGHPLFTEELASALRDAGLIQIWNGECFLSPEAGDLKTAHFPDNLEAVITSRIDRLSPQLQLVLKVASVIGRVFSLSLLKAIHPIEADRPGIPEHVAGLERRGLITLKGGSVADPNYSFKHALTQEVAYNLLPFAQRQQLHQAVAEYTERIYRDRVELHYPLLALHWYRVVAPGGLVSSDQHPPPELVTRAVGYLQRAGDQAFRNGAGQEAVEHYTRAIELLASLPASSERTEQEIALQIALGNAIIAARGVASDEVERTFARARELCREVGDTRHLFPVLFGLWMYYFVRADHRVSQELAEQLLVFAERRRERVPLMVAHRTLGTQLFHRGELGRARAHLERAIALYAPDFDRPLAFLYTHDPRVAGLSVLALCLFLQGSPGEADERSKVALSLARELGHAPSTAFAVDHAAILRQMAGDEPAARAQVEASAQLGREHGHNSWHSYAVVVQAWSMAEQGQVDEAIDQLRQAIVELQFAGMNLFWPWVLGVYADLCGRAGRGAEALALVTEAIGAARQSSARAWEAELLRKRGELLLAQRLADDGPEGSPEACFAAAIHCAREQGARALELRAAQALLCLDRRSPASAALLEETRVRLGGKLESPAEPR
jgi:class 3 adenylate cyclase/tetratricopeptide (TPR) repeat protein